MLRMKLMIDSKMKVLFIGGTGIISSACTEKAIKDGVELYLLNRGESHRKAPSGAKSIVGDIRKPEEIKNLISEHHFDAVVDWIAFTPEHIRNDIDIFRGKTDQFVFISSASVYDTPTSYPVTEKLRAHNPFWAYSQDKIACEEILKDAYEKDGFPVTIIRPSHTYDKTLLPVSNGYTVVDRMIRGKEVVVHGDGTSLWTLTHHKDFATGFVPVLGNKNTIGETYHITGNEWLSWNQIFDLVAEAFGTEAKKIHVPSEVINIYDSEWGAGLLGDKSVSMIFDNTKIKQMAPDLKTTIPFAEGVKELAAWYQGDSSRQVVDDEKNQLMDRIIADWTK